jgi:carboxylesterase
MNSKPFSLYETFTPNPAQSYSDAVMRIQEVQVNENSLDLHSECKSQLMTHGEKTQAVIVLLHGFTSCPAQFQDLGKEYFDLGYNVYIPRLPGHGFNDRRGEHLQGITAEEMAAFANQSADIAQGLGEQVIFSGISGGGAIVTYLAQDRNDIAVAAPIAPFLGVSFVPHQLNRAFANFILSIPDFWMWWDPIHKENNKFAEPYANARYPMHALVEMMRLGYVSQAAAEQSAPEAEKIVMITNANDSSVNNGVAAEFEELWKEHGYENIVAYEFPKSLKLAHDLITAIRPGARTDLVYPKLIELTK